MVQGSCCCGAVRYTLETAPTTLGMCHCSRCRKVGASAIFFTKRENLTITAGRDAIAVYKPEPPHKYERSFCKLCGTPLGEILSDLDSFPINANTLDEPVPMTVSFHEWTGEKPAWLEIATGD